MKILHIISGMDPRQGGVTQAVRTMIKGLEETDGSENEVVSLDTPGSPYLSEDGLQIHALGPAKGPWCFSRQLLPWLLNNIPRFDAVIVHGLWQYHGYAAKKAMAALKRRLQFDIGNSRKLPRFYVMPHGMLDPYFQRDPSRRLKAIRNSIYWRILERQIIKDATGILFTCEDEKILARKTFHHYQPRNEMVIGLGVEQPPDACSTSADSFSTTCPELGSRPYFLFLSRINPKKGVDLLIRAYADLVTRTGKNRACSEIPSLVIAGPLDSDYAVEMQDLARKLMPASGGKDENLPQIHFPGMLRGPSKWGAFHGCEAFILPSHQENFGIAVVEALACGKPVLISDKVNIWREIDSAGGGIVVNDDVLGTKDVLRQWMETTADHRKHMGSRAKDAYHRNFTIGSAARSLSTVLTPAPMVEPGSRLVDPVSPSPDPVMPGASGSLAAD